jgi:hypothetical protein
MSRATSRGPAGTRSAADGLGGRGLGHGEEGLPGARARAAAAAAGTRRGGGAPGRGGGSPFPGGGSGGGVAVALLSRGAAASCRQSRLQKAAAARCSPPSCSPRPRAPRHFPVALGRGFAAAGREGGGGAAGARPRPAPRGGGGRDGGGSGPGSLSTFLPPEMKGRCPCQGSRPS